MPKIDTTPDDPDVQALAAELRAIAEREQWSDAQFAEQAGVHQTTATRWLNGEGLLISARLVRFLRKYDSASVQIPS